MPSSPAPWCHAYDAELTAVRREDDGLEVALWLPRLARSATMRLDGVTRFDWRPDAHTWDDEDVADLDAIGGAGLTVEGARWTRDGRDVVVLTTDGTLYLACADVAPEPGLTEDWRAFWADWGAAFDEPVHPAVRAWLVDGAGPPVDALLETWRRERTSDLALLIDALDDPTTPVRLEALEDVARWVDTFAEGPVGATRELARCAAWTFDPWLDDRPVADAWWERLTWAIARVDPAPDPRVGHALLDTLYSPSDYWFRLDQVAHIAGPFEAASDDPSFADHLFARLDAHADAGTADHALEVREAILPECDCNGAEMGDRLLAFADEVRARYPEDRRLSRDARAAAAWHAGQRR